MFRIGEFSRLSQVSVRMLRHYDRLGLLRPAQVDEQSGYRYYSAEQLSFLHRILALKDLGFTLEEVGDLLRGGVSPEQVVGMLKLKRAQLRRELEEGAARLERIEARLANFTESGDTVTPAGGNVVLKRVPAQRVAAHRAVIPTYLDGATLLLDPILEFLAPHGLKPVGGGWFYVYHDPDYREARIDAEAAVPLPRPVSAPPPGGPVTVYEMPAVATAASMVHTGAVMQIGRTYTELGHWIEANGYRIVGPNRMLALRRDLALPERAVTEVQWPVERIAPSASRILSSPKTGHD